MAETVFTFAGKAGDALHQWPIAYWWAKENDKKFTCWMDERSTKFVAPLFAAQSCVEKVEFKTGVETYSCGGQPWHFDIPPSEYQDKEVHHLGFRNFPQRQITLETLENSKLGLNVTQEQLADEPSIVAPGSPEGFSSEQRICLLHGQAVYSNTKGTPRFWTFLSDIAPELEERFDRIVFVGNERDREVGERLYPEWETFDDHGSFLELAQLMKLAGLVIGCGSSVVSLAGLLKVNSIRVHDPIGEHPKVIWSNLQKNHLNLTEPELRSAWKGWRNQWLGVEVG
jgi:ADP-heptose:LPS heptosyltransferase